MITNPSPTPQGVAFDSLKAGDTFFFPDKHSTYIKVRIVSPLDGPHEIGLSYNAVELSTGKLASIAPTTPVQLFNAELKFI